MDVYVYMREPAVTVLGPGRRYALWVQGCERKCKGCTAQSSWNMQEGETIAVEALAMEIALSDATGITISGGEPFLQSAALAQMLAIVHRLRPDMGVILYTGYLYEEIKNMPDTAALLAHTDLLIDGPYMEEFDDGASLRGSSNQRIIPISNRYIDQLHLYGVPGERPVEVFNRGGYLHIAGVANLDRANDERSV